VELCADGASHRRGRGEVNNPMAYRPLHIDYEVSVVCATRNLEGDAALFVKRLTRVIEEYGHSWCLIVVDDSDDETPAVIAAAIDSGLPLRLIHRRPPERVGGHSGAIVEGIGVAMSPIVLVVDATLTVPPETLVDLIDSLFTGRPDIAIASASRRSWASQGRWHSFVLGMTTAISKLMFSETRRVKDPSSDVFAFRREVLEGVVLKPERFRVLIEVIVRGRWRSIAEFEYDGFKMLGASQTTARDALLFLSRLARLWLETRVDPLGRAEASGPRRRWDPEVLADRNEDCRPARVLVVASEVPPVTSGVARSVARLGDELQALGHHVAYRSSLEAWRGAIGEFRVTNLGFKLLRDRAVDSFDVILLHGPVPTMSEVVLVGHALRRRRTRPALVYTHHFDIEIANFGVMSILYNVVNHRLANLADHVVTTSPSYGEVIGRKSRTPLTVIPWGVDPAVGPPRSTVYDGTRRLRVLFVGQQRPYKGVANLIMAVAGSPQLELTVVGSGPLESSHRQLVANLAATNVSLLGRVSDDDLLKMMASHDVIALPSVSRLEAFGLVLLEGMAAGCVPVAADLPGVRDVIGEEGVLVAPRRVISLREALEDLARCPAEVQRRSLAAVERADRFRWETTAQAYDAVFSAVGAQNR
jgi:glycosyltransferase involved in cell wall biosynthesis